MAAASKAAKSRAARVSKFEAKKKEDERRATQLKQGSFAVGARAGRTARGAKGQQLREKETVEGYGRMWVFGKHFQYGQVCSFCIEATAFYMCEDCDTDGDGVPDWLCEKCDKQIHSFVKRAGHLRTEVPLFTAAAAAKKIRGFFRWTMARNRVRNRIREVYDRFYDSQARQYFYYDRRSKKTQWFKPKLLGKEELKPYMSEDTAAFKIQGYVRTRQGRMSMQTQIRKEYDKIFSRDHQRFYYFYNGPSKLIPEMAWKKPKHLWYHDLRPVRTIDISAIIIQNAYHTYKGRNFVKKLLKLRWKRKRDPLSGKYFFYNRATQASRWSAPLMLGGDRWDPLDMGLWTAYDVCVWLRRMKYKKYVERFTRYNVTGRVLATFQDVDFANLKMDTLHQKKIMVEMMHLPFWKHHHVEEIDIIKRDSLRYHFDLERSASLLQRHYRARYNRQMFRQMQTTARLAVAQEERRKRIAATGKWWNTLVTERGDELVPKGKTFGKRAPYKGVRGWGGYNGNEHTAAPEGTTDTHPTQEWVDKAMEQVPNMKHTALKPETRFGSKGFSATRPSESKAWLESVRDTYALPF
jgi:hypothetical protein